MNPLLFPDGSGNPLLAAGEYINDAAGRRRDERMARREEIGNRLLQTWPVEAARAAYDAVTLPGDVYAGRVDPMSDEGIGRAFELAGGVTLGSAAAPVPRGAVTMGAARRVDDFSPASPAQTGIRAYHGSPHDFNRFSLKYINTGEGAQARGHGLYFAEIEDVAREYRDRLSQGKAPGRLYEVRINADPDAFLDWDAPVSEQSERVRQSLLDLGIGTRPSHERLKGDQVHRRLAHAADVPAERSRQAAAQALRESGIPGIKYLDAGSRASGQGSRNYVVFDDSLIEILRKYGVSGLAALPAGVLAGMGLTREQAEDLDANRAM